MDRRISRNIQRRLLEIIFVKVINATGAIFYSIETNRILMQLRSVDCSFPLTWSLWGGKKENNERPSQTLIREIQEEIGFVPDLLKVYPLHQYRSKDNGFIYDSFCCVVQEEFIPSINHESAGYCWVNLGFWPKPLHQGARSLLLSKSFRNKLDAMITHIRTKENDSRSNTLSFHQTARASV